MSEEDFKSSADMNTWGYQPDMISGAANFNYLPGPSNAESVIDKTSTANTLSNNYGIVLAAKINTDLPAGSYKNTYVLTATSNATTYSVHYNNLEDTAGGPSPNPQTGQTDGNSFKLSDQTPVRDSYKFLGYCMLKPDEDGNCETAVLQPGTTFVIYCNENNIELWAMWEETDPTMQNFLCTSLTKIGQSSTRRDTRDNNTYTVTKLNDGRCWMTQNLKIVNKTLTSADSDVKSNFKLPSSSSSGFNDPNYDVAYAYIHSTYGGYYSWYAATAGEGKQSTSINDQNVEHSICPKGWKLPNKAEYETLISKQDSANLTKSPANFQLGGFHMGTYGIGGQGGYGYYWSSTAANSDAAYMLSMTDNYAYVNTGLPASESSKYYGMTIRCVARQ